MASQRGAGDLDPRDVLVAWRREHEELSRRAGAVSSALEAGDGASARQAFESLESLVADHLREEEEVVFPQAEKRAPEAARPLRSLAIAHVGYRQDLALIESQLRRGQLEAARVVFEAFLESFQTHERLEDQLLRLLD